MLEFAILYHLFACPRATDVRCLPMSISSLNSGNTISHYRIVKKLDGDGMGIVYKAEDMADKARLRYFPAPKGPQISLLV